VKGLKKQKIPPEPTGKEDCLLRKGGERDRGRFQDGSEAVALRMFRSAIKKKKNRKKKKKKTLDGERDIWEGQKNSKKGKRNCKCPWAKNELGKPRVIIHDCSSPRDANTCSKKGGAFPRRLVRLKTVEREDKSTERGRGFFHGA